MQHTEAISQRKALFSCYVFQVGGGLANVIFCLIGTELAQDDC